MTIPSIILCRKWTQNKKHDNKLVTYIKETRGGSDNGKNGTCFKIDNLIFRHIYKHPKKKHDISKNSNYFLSSTNEIYQSTRSIDYHKMLFC
jgi:hypothetical protein